MKSLLHVYKTYFPDTMGGVEQCIHGLSLGLLREGVQPAVAVCTAAPSAVQQEKNQLPYPVYRFPTTFEAASCPVSAAFLKNFKKLVQPYDRVCFHFPWPFQDLLAATIDKPYWVTYHSDIVRQKNLNYFYQPLMHHFLSRAEKIIATSPRYIETSPVLQRYRKKTVSIPIGTERSLYPALDEVRRARWKAQLGNNFVFFMGVLRYYKGVHVLLQAAREVPYPIVIAGRGPLEAELKAQASSLGLNNVHFVGFVDEADKVALLELCRLVIAPAHLRSEAFCISLLEGLLFGKPLISTEIGTGTSFVNTHAQTGLVVPPENPQAMAQAIIQLYTNEALYQHCAQGAIQHYQAHFTLEKMAQAYIALA